MAMGDSGNPLIDALDRQGAAIETMAAAIKAANPAAVQSAISWGLEQGLGSAPAELQAAIKAAQKTAEAGVASAKVLTARRIRDYERVAGITGFLMILTLTVGWQLGTRDEKDQVTAAVAEEHARMASAAAWAGTPSGRAAQELDRSGALDMLAHCAAPGLHRGRQNGRDTCFPDAQFTGWFLD